MQEICHTKCTELSEEFQSFWGHHLALFYQHSTFFSFCRSATFSLFHLIVIRGALHSVPGSFSTSTTALSSGLSRIINNFQWGFGLGIYENNDPIRKNEDKKLRLNHTQSERFVSWCLGCKFSWKFSGLDWTQNNRNCLWFSKERTISPSDTKWRYSQSFNGTYQVRSWVHIPSVWICIYLS